MGPMTAFGTKLALTSFSNKVSDLIIWPCCSEFSKIKRGGVMMEVIEMTKIRVKEAMSMIRQIKSLEQGMPIIKSQKEEGIIFRGIFR